MAPSTIVHNDLGPTPSTTSHNGFVPGSSGNRRADPPGPAKRPLPHIDDVSASATAVDVSATTPIETIVQRAETLLRQAETSRTLTQRPDLALADYIKANHILLNVIKQNKDWVSLPSREVQHSRYQRLLRQAMGLFDEYEKVKAVIIDDNHRTGAQPTRRKLDSYKPNTVVGAENGPSGGRPMVSRAADFQHAVSPIRSPDSPSRMKPPIQPKPQALHGNALPTTNATASPGDLNERFARLRMSPAIQDPRIRTKPIIPQGPQHPAVLSEPLHPTALPVTAAVGGMPRIPDAIYNPVRGTVSKEAAELPSSAPRAIFTRTNSSLSAPKVVKSPKIEPAEDYFVPAHAATIAPRKRIKPSLATDNTISPDDLFEHMKAGAKQISILLIDIRPRDLFDEGHIMSQATICLDPTALSRPNISAIDISESNILSPAEEQVLFDQRHRFHLIVFYDQDSTSIVSDPKTPAEKAITGLYNALTLFDFPNAMVTNQKDPPKLLTGGIEAWTALMGTGGLQSSSTSSSSKPSISTPLTRSLIGTSQTPMKRSPDALSSIGPIRTTDEFFRRPQAYRAQESMRPPTLPPRHHFNESLLIAPTRPSRAITRPTTTGFHEAPPETAPEPTRAAGTRPRLRAGLHNPGWLCFENCTLQALLSTPGFGRDVSTGAWRTEFADSDTMALTAEVFDDLVNGGKTVEPKKLVEHIKQRHRATEASEKELYGGPQQQDASLFAQWFITQIALETNIHERPPREYTWPRYTGHGNVVQNAMAAWQDYTSNYWSIAEKYFQTLEMSLQECPHCKDALQVTTVYPILTLWPPNSKDTDLNALLKHHTRKQILKDYTCDKCNHEGRHHIDKFGRLPDRLIVKFGRFSLDHKTKTTSKISSRITFPFHDLDLTEFMVNSNPRNHVSEDPRFGGHGRMLYDLYAVSLHSGKDLTHGHYYTYAQDENSNDPTDWLLLNDSLVERVKIGTNDKRDQSHKVYSYNTAQAFVLYYKRKGT